MFIENQTYWRLRQSGRMFFQNLFTEKFLLERKVNNGKSKVGVLS